ncbi:MAG TPA: MFS transporter, partial [Jatrophihabitantaceae bacterium]
RFVTDRVRRRLVEPLRFLLAAPYVAFVFHPPLAIEVALAFAASAGYAASLPLQERLVSNTEPGIRGQVLGLNGTGMLAMQGIGAVLAGALAQQLGGDHAGVATAIGLTGCASLAVTVSLVPGLRRSRLPQAEAAYEPA